MFKKIIKKYKEEFKQCINDLKHKETIYKQIPNLITILRPLGMIPSNILFFTGHPAAAVILTAILLSTDFIDGKLARAWNVQSKLGADLDAIGDKIIFLGMSLPLIISHPLFLLNVIFELIISYVNVKGRIDGLETKTVYSGKVKTCFLSVTLLSGYLAQFFNLPLEIFNSLIITTTISQGIAYYEYINKYYQMKYDKLEKTTNKNEIVQEKPKDKTKENLKEELIREKEFLLSMKEPDKKEKTKKKIRKK